MVAATQQADQKEENQRQHVAHEELRLFMSEEKALGNKRF